MKNLARLLLGLAFTLAFGLWLTGVAAAQLVYDVANYKALADADSAETIPPGTKITLQNWQQYKKFMPVWMQVAYQGQYKWQVGKEPGYTVEVGPTHHYPMVRKFVENTEKYGGQTKLIPLPSGGMNWQGYVAGVPFPNPTEPNLGVKLAYNSWDNFQPMILNFRAFNWIVDSYGNVTNLETDDTFYRTMHLSDPPDGPINLPFANGYNYVTRFLVLIPEQSKYSTEMTLRPDDPTHIDEVYAFVPALRRSLRLSSAARCAPILGTDFIQDDNSWLPPNFKITFLGKKKLLTPIQEPAKAYDRNSYIQPPTGFPGWPKYGTGKWELRDYNLLNFEWLTSLGAYCYSQRVFYQDAENWIVPESENYDRNGKFWKQLWIVQSPVEFRGQNTLVQVQSIAAVLAIDFQNSHITATAESPTTVDEDGAGTQAGPVPAQYRDMATMTKPSSLAQIMK
jgi:Protein of unknown function (DUF1329)